LDLTWEQPKIEVRIGKLDRITCPDIMQIIGSLSFKEVSPLDPLAIRTA
jgi:hypothetical protein